ncbi:glucose 1-dehydrogenase [Iamia sp.]|uniref:SDR family NAD(P)-dependent oxidoreductase n=1 Tax=Iamia sp. TaxID=2722710 RepID=UPI002CD0F348|nr:glucose 1-dehydrogenase [Iamia sp.]HXH56054.1 glucose 1-dehydrogenase [Iamia sp.]
MGRLDGKVAIITGAARGQGEAEARLFAAEGAKVVVADVLADEARDVAEAIGDAARAVALDVTDEDAWTRVVAETTDTWGPITTLVNNAGILDFNAIDRYDTERFRTVLDVNVMGAFLGIKSVTRSMAASGNGSIVNISSNGGMEGLPFLSAYSTSKWALRGLSRSAAIELGRRGIRVNTVHPGGIDTPMTRFEGNDASSATFYQKLPIKRVGTVDDVAPVVLFLASDEAGYVTGSEYVVDGGHLAGDASVLTQVPGTG